MPTHNLHLEAVPGGWSVSGAVAIEHSRLPTVDAASALVAIGNASPKDSIRVEWQGSPFVASVAAVRNYRPSLARRAAERSGATSLHSHFGHVG
jgi:hypothetical protein